MRVLVACECSGVVRNAFRAKGHDAWSIDLNESEDNSEYHIVGDVRTHLDAMSSWRMGYDLMIAHPPCDRLAVSGNAWRKGNEEAQAEAVEFFLYLATFPIPKVAVENPVGIMSTIYRKPDQYIQPWQFGHDASKKTGLWLRGLPLLIPTDIVEPRVVDGKPRWSNQTDSGQNKLGPSPTRAADRARTYLGIAKAMAEQWT